MTWMDSAKSGGGTEWHGSRMAGRGGAGWFGAGGAVGGVLFDSQALESSRERLRQCNSGRPVGCRYRWSDTSLHEP